MQLNGMGPRPAEPRGLPVKRILVVDDEAAVRGAVSLLIRKLGHQALTASRGEQGVLCFRRERPHLTILDLGLPDMSGIEVFKRIHALVPEHPIIILTGTGTEEMELEARKLGVSDFLVKGSSLAALREMVERLMGASPSSASPSAP